MARIIRSQVYWGPVSGVTQETSGLLRFQTPNDGTFLVHPSLTKLRPPGPTAARPYMKCLRWNNAEGERVAVAVESRAADAVPFDVQAMAFYLIKRTDSGLLATPGGFIDNADGAGGEESIMEISRRAARRELMEETGAETSQMYSLFSPLLEAIPEGSNLTSREVITISYPFGAAMTMTELHPADDAQQAPGDAGLLPGWYRFSSLPALIPQLHFAHHATILTRLARFADSGKRDGKTTITQPDMRRLTCLRAYYFQMVFRDVKAMLKGNPPLLLSDARASAAAAIADFRSRTLLGHDF